MGIFGDLKSLKARSRADFLARFFKTGPGDYAEGDVFYGLSVPQSRDLAKKYADLPFTEISALLKSEIHEARLIALIIMNRRFSSADAKDRKRIFQFLVKHRKGINNWDLVDTIAPSAFGEYLFTEDRSLLYKYAVSKNLWERRIAIMSTLYFLRQNDFDDTLKIAKILLNDEQDLIHKATGWMLREVGKRDLKKLTNFLDKYATKMPRAMLRYAIEKFPEKQRKYYLNLK